MNATTLRVDEPREILALIPHRLGFRPRDSAVAVSLQAPRGRVGVVARVDLTALADPTFGPHCARSLVALLDRDGARRAILVLYADQDPRVSGDDAPARAAGHVQDAAAYALGEVPVWVVTPGGYLALDCVDDCCPPGGRALRDLDATQVGAQLVLAGSAVAGSRQDLGRIRPASAERRRAVARVRRRWQAKGEEARRLGDVETQAWRADSVHAWRAAFERVPGRPPGAAPLGRLEAGLADRRVRDAVLVGLVPGTGDLPERSVQGEAPDPRDDAEVRTVVESILQPGTGPGPDPEMRRTHEEVLEQVVAHGSAGDQAPALTLLALLSWWAGDGARASVLLERARSDDPGYRLADLLQGVLAAAVPPGWVVGRIVSRE